MEMIFVLHRHRSLEYFYVSVCVVFEFCLTLTFLVSIYISLVNRRFWVRDWTYSTSQLVVDTSFDKNIKFRSSHYNFVRCSLDAFGKKVASRPGVVINPLSSRVKTSKWFQGILALPTLV